MSRVDIKISFQCNNHCIFCVQGDKRNYCADKTLKEIKTILKAERAVGKTSVVFTGGEVTLRRDDLLSSVKYAKTLGYQDIQIQTNGRLFSYLSFCNEIISAGANEFTPALHGSSAIIHDELTMSPGSFAQTVQGIKNLKLLNQRVLTNSVITKKNYKDLPQLASLLVSLKVDQFQLAFIHINQIIANDNKKINKIVPKVSHVMPYVKQALDIGIISGANCMTEAIPYCLMKGYENYIAEKIIPEANVFDAEKPIKNYSQYRRNHGKSKGDNCINCMHNQACEGPWKEYPKIFGWDEFKPVNKNPKPAINQMNIRADLITPFFRLDNIVKNKHIKNLYIYYPSLFKTYNASHLPTYKQIIKKLKLLYTQRAAVNLFFVGFPLCIFSKADMSWFAERIIKFNSVYTNKCEDCVLKKDCFGIPKDYVKFANLKDIKTIHNEDIFNSNDIRKNSHFLQQKWTEGKKHQRFFWEKYFKDINGSILDVGAGLGEFVSFSPKKNIGIDNNIDNINNYMAQKYKLNLMHGDMLKLDFPDNYFAGIYNHHVIEHLNSTREAIQAFREMKRVLNKNGKLLVIMAGKDSREDTFMSNQSGHHLLLSKEKLEQMICSIGFSKYRIFPYVFIEEFVNFNFDAKIDSSNLKEYSLILIAEK